MDYLSFYLVAALPGPLGKPTEGGYSVEEGWEPDSNGGSCLPCTGSREEGTPPPHPVGPQIMIPPNPVRQRYIPYHPPLGFIGYPHPHSSHGVYRYSLTSPSVVMGSPRPPTPLGSEKSSRETTPPTHAHPPVMSPIEKGIDFPMTTAPPSSASPPIQGGALSETTSVAIVPPPPGPAAGPGGPPPNGGNIHQYNAPGYPMFAMGAGPFVAHLSGFLPSSSTLPNGYVSPHTIPPNFPVPSVTHGMTSGGGELMYPPGPFPVMAQTTLATSSCSAGGVTHPPVLHQSSVGGPPVPYTSPPYQTPQPPPSSNPVPPPTKKPLTCYNCGKVGHRGSECKEASIDEMTKRTKVGLMSTN